MSERTRLAVLAGGVGGSRFVDGLARAVPPAEITVIGNVGDDFEHLGLHISPDLDTLVYTLAGVVNEETGWGRRDETGRALEVVKSLDGEDWFFLGDRDLGLHLVRTERLRRGEPLSSATDAIRRSLGVDVRILPASDDPVRTVVVTDRGELDFQTYFVRHRHEPEVRGVRFDGAEAARPAPGVLEAIESAELVVIGPSNPFLSIEPILAVAGIRETLAGRDRPVAAVSPVVGGKAIKGPADRLLATFEGEVTPVAVARRYAPFLTHMLADAADAGSLGRLAALGLKAATCDTIMRDEEARAAVARALLELARTPS
jgi:LPPG:FO 2-phospho-L-lactate transferase